MNIKENIKKILNKLKEFNLFKQREDGEYVSLEVIAAVLANETDKSAADILNELSKGQKNVNEVLVSKEVVSRDTMPNNNTKMQIENKKTKERGDIER